MRIWADLGGFGQKVAHLAARPPLLSDEIRRAGVFLFVRRLAYRPYFPACAFLAQPAFLQRAFFSRPAGPAGRFFWHF
jgi:hypothetical protein